MAADELRAEQLRKLLAAETPLPVPVSDHRDRRIQVFVVGGHQPPGGGPQSEHIEVIPRGHLSKDLFDDPINFHW